ncbi:TlpA family protein disulfide reductase [Actinokineospora enzanensis]|uniref:TlpA family protein disulfide reductase n=1 Tax=Actinokineospora enzanensis TaxID=155975 RepID=UPI000375BE97|nr:TlpA disulfide reductase family protein [Actinokineospora enzanensis]
MRKLLVGVLTGVLALSACSAEKDAGTDSNFVFVSPGGKTDITYDGPDRKPLPDMSGPDLLDDSKRLSLTDYRGKVVVINVWGQWCGPCRTEAPRLQEVQNTYEANGVQVLGIDVRDNDRQAAQDFVRDRKLTYPSVYDPPGRSLLALKGVPRAVVPATFVIDKQGRVAAVFLRDLLAEDLAPVLDELVAE